MPQIVWTLCKEYGAFIVGGACLYLLEESNNLKDIDIIVPLKHWNDAVFILPDTAKINTYGGFKFDSGETFYDNKISIDVWCQDLSEYCLNHNTMFPKYAINIYNWRVIEIKNVYPK